MKYLYCLVLFLSFFFFNHVNVLAQRKMEKLGRGVVATRSESDKALISWRLLGTEPRNLGFNIYRKEQGGTAVKLNDSILTKGTDWVDKTADFSVDNQYFVKPVEDSVELSASKSYTLKANTPVQPYFEIPIHSKDGYSSEGMFVGDLDGDGEYDFVMDKQPADNSKEHTYLEAYLRDGTFLWEIDLGSNSITSYRMRPGASAIDIGHSDDWTVYDINNDGKAEVILKTANGVVFGDGKVLDDPTANDTTQFISIIDGMTGSEISRTKFDNPHPENGPMTGHMIIAYLDGINPSLVWEYKNRRWDTDQKFQNYVDAYHWNGDKLERTWQFSLREDTMPHQITGHQIRAIDLDGDGKDELVPMSFALDDDGTLLYNLGYKDDIWHGDRFFIGDLDPHREGLEDYGIQQGYSVSGIQWFYTDAKTGELLLAQRNPDDGDLGRGYVGDLDPRYDGYEFYTFVDGIYNVSGEKTSTKLFSSYPNLRIWWDGDLGSEMLDRGKFVKWDYKNSSEKRLYTADGVINLPREVPLFYGDILGDWREEVVYETSDHQHLRIYTTPYFTDKRIYTLPHDPAYRVDMTNKGYQQSLMTDYYLGFNMDPPPIPPIQQADVYWNGGVDSVWNRQNQNWLNQEGQSAAFENGDVVMFDLNGNNQHQVKISEEIMPSKLFLTVPAGHDYTIIGTEKIKGDMKLVKSLDGTVTLHGNQVFTGTTSIDEGILVINGNYKSSIIVHSHGVLGGNGIMEGGVQLEQGVNGKQGGIDPGKTEKEGSLGTLVIQGGLTLPGHNNLIFDIGSGGIPSNDSIKVIGDFNVNGINTIKIRFKDSIVSGNYTLITATGKLNVTKDDFELSGAFGVNKEIRIVGNQVKLVVKQEHQPSTVLWRGARDGVWDLNKKNFLLNGQETSFVSYDSVLFKSDALTKDITLDEGIYTSGLSFGDADYTIRGVGNISGPGGVYKYEDGGQLSILLATNTYTGRTEIHGGRLLIKNLAPYGTPSSLGKGNSSSDDILLENVYFSILNDSYSNRTLTLLGNDTLNVPKGKNIIFKGNVNGTGNLVKTGGGSLWLIDSNALAGSIEIKEGIVNLRTKEGNEGGLGTSDSIIIGNATLNFQDVRSYPHSAQIRYNFIIPEGKEASIRGDGRSSMLGTLTGNGTLNFTTTYVRTDMEGDWSGFNGKLNILGSDFRIANDAGYPNAVLDLKEGVMYPIDYINKVEIGALNGAENTSIDKAVWIVGNRNEDAVFRGEIKGDSVVKVGSGRWTLTGANIYEGGTLVKEGQLIINNSSGSGTGSGDIKVLGKGTIGGNGEIQGSLLLDSSAVLSPGDDSIGHFKVDGQVHLSSESITKMEINTASDSHDVLAVNEELNLNGLLEVVVLENGNIRAGDQFKLFDANSIKGDFLSIQPESPGDGLIWEFVKDSGILRAIPDPNNLPVDNFLISTSDVSCRSGSNGKIIIESKAAYSYNVTIEEQPNKKYSFTHEQPLEINGLKPGKYHISISIKGNESSYRDFTVSINEPDPLSVYTSVNMDRKRLSLRLSGADSSGYWITLNMDTYHVNKKNVTLDLESGMNRLAVKTDKGCQGVYSRKINTDNKGIVYPNPFSDIIYVKIDNIETQNATVEVYDTNGEKVFYGRKTISSNKFRLNLSKLVSGIYLLKVETIPFVRTYKIIKR